MKLNIKSLLPLSLSIVTLLLSGCLKEADILQKTTADEGNRVRFSITNAATRSSVDNVNPTATPALDREKAVTDLYAVVYKESGLYFNTIKCEKENGAGNTYYFDVKTAGQFQFRFVANPDNALLEKLRTESNVIGDLQDIVVSKLPGEDKNATGFVLTSDRYEVNVAANKTVELPSVVKLKRLSARFDFLNRVPELEITKITFSGRVEQSYLYSRTSINGLTVSNDKTYEAAQGLTGKICKGMIYGYENPEINKTYFTIEGTYKGNPINPYRINLDNLAIKRNYLYTVIISPLGGKVDPGKQDDPSKAGELKFDIKVLDWEMDTDTDIKAKDADIYSFYVEHSANVSNASYMDAFLTDSPSKIYTVTNKATSVVISVGTYLAPGTLEFDGQAPNGVTLEKTGAPEGGSDGIFIQKYKLNLPETTWYDPLANFQNVKGGDFLAVKLAAKSPSGRSSDNFTVLHGRMKTPLEQLSQYPLAKLWKDDNYQSGASTDATLEPAFNTTSENDKQKYLNPHKATRVLNKPGVVIDGKTWHLPESDYEWNCIFNNGSKSIDSYTGPTAPVLTQNISEYVVLPRLRRIAGDKFENGILHFYADYAVNKENKNISYAIKFKASKENNGTDGRFLTAYRYEWKGDFTPGSKTSQVVVTSRYLGLGYKGGIADIANETFWNKNNADDATRVFPMAGRFNNWIQQPGIVQQLGTSLYCLTAKDEKDAGDGVSKYRSVLQINAHNVTYTYCLIYVEKPTWQSPLIYLFTHEL
jgi:hypothetical protein